MQISHGGENEYYSLSERDAVQVGTDISEAIPVANFRGNLFRYKLINEALIKAHRAASVRGKM